MSVSDIEVPGSVQRGIKTQAEPQIQATTSDRNSLAYDLCYSAAARKDRPHKTGSKRNEPGAINIKPWVMLDRRAASLQFAFRQKFANGLSESELLSSG